MDNLKKDLEKINKMGDLIADYLELSSTLSDETMELLNRSIGGNLYELARQLHALNINAENTLEDYTEALNQVIGDII